MKFVLICLNTQISWLQNIKPNSFFFANLTQLLNQVTLVHAEMVAIVQREEPSKKADLFSKSSVITRRFLQPFDSYSMYVA